MTVYMHYLCHAKKYRIFVFCLQPSLLISHHLQAKAIPI